MPRAILNCGPDSIYDDDLPFRYHFLDEHRTEFIKCIGHQVLFYEPRHSGGRKAYTATATVVSYYADNDKGVGHFYGVLKDFRYFDEIVPHKIDGRYFESKGLTSRGQFTGRKSVRFPLDEEFDRILELGGRLSAPPAFWNPSALWQVF